MSCFNRGDAAVKELKERFRLELSDKDCIEFVNNLIKESLSNWRTGAYDSYQYYVSKNIVYNYTKI